MPGKTLSSKGLWKQIELHPGLKEDDPEFHFLNTFEEMETYDVVKDKKKEKVVKKKKVDAPQKQQQSLDEPISQEPPPHQQNGDRQTSKMRKKPKPVQVKGRIKDGVKRKRSTVDAETILEATPLRNDVGDGTVPSSSADMSAWDGLFVPQPIIERLAELGFTKPTPIQTLVLPPAIRDRVDVMGAAETGSGKTLAFGIPILTKLLDSMIIYGKEVSRPFALVMTPTRELAVQIHDHLKKIIPDPKIKLASLIGGLSIDKQSRLLRHLPHILVATPGRLWELMSQSDAVMEGIRAVKCLAVDETDRMVEKGHFEELASILAQIQNDEEQNKKRQTFIFSATLTFVHPPPRRLGSKKKRIKSVTPDDKIASLIDYVGLRPGYQVMDITRPTGTASCITESRINCNSLLEKDTHLYYFLKNYPGRTLVFANSVDGARRLANLFSKLNYEPLLLHAKMHQKQRLKNLEKFTKNPKGLLLSTDVAARGLDIPHIQHIIHYQVPRTSEVYVHRSGRTGRAEQDGLSVMLVDGTDAAVYKRICSNLNRVRDLPVFPVDDKMYGLLKEHVQLATQIESLEHQSKRTISKEQWFVKQAREMDMELDDDEIVKTLGDNVLEAREQQVRVKRMMMNLKGMMAVPVRRMTNVTKYPKLEDHVDRAVEDPISLVQEEEAKMKKLKFSGRIKLKANPKRSKERAKKAKRKGKGAKKAKPRKK